MWTLSTCHGTTVFYDPDRPVCMHAEKAEDGWRPLYLWSPDRVHGLLLPDCIDAVDHVIPVRVRFYSETQCSLLVAKCGLDECLLSAKPEGSEWPGSFIEATEIAADWEKVTIHAGPERLGIHQKSLRAFSNLLEQRPSAEDLVGRQTDETALRWFLAFQEYELLDALGHEAIKQPGREFLRSLGASARQPGVRHAYETLADWLEDRGQTAPIEFLGPDFDVFDPWPGMVPFAIDLELISRIRRHVEPRRKACVLATLRNEGPYILEWFSYHRALGFEHFFIYTNNNNDGSEDLLAALAETGDVTLITHDARSARPQYKAYGHALKALPHILDYEWALVIDGDEFLVLSPDGRFPDIVKYIDWICIRPADAVGFNWLMFNAFGVENAEIEKPVALRFGRRVDEVNRHIKTMFRPRYFAHAHAHFGYELRGLAIDFLNSNGDPHLHETEKAHSTYPVANAAWINHYWTKSAHEFCRKILRNGGDIPSSVVRPPAEVEKMLANMQRADANLPSVEDHRILARLDATESLLGKLLANPRVRAAHEASIASQRKHIDALMQQIAADREGRTEARTVASA